MLLPKPQASVFYVMILFFLKAKIRGVCVADSGLETVSFFGNFLAVKRFQTMLCIHRIKMIIHILGKIEVLA